MAGEMMCQPTNEEIALYGEALDDELETAGAEHARRLAELFDVFFQASDALRAAYRAGVRTGRGEK